MLTGRDAWVVALAASGLVAFVVTPLSARRRDGRARRSVLTSSAGLFAGVAVVLPFLDDADTPLVVGVVAALGLWVVGSLVDRGHVPRVAAPWALGAATVAVTAAGLRLHVTGFSTGDVVVTLVVVFAAASAWRSGLTRDGLLAGWAVAAGVSAGLLGYFAGQDSLVAVGAVIVGASVGFLAYWFPPSAARLRVAGSKLLGFLAVVAALDARPVLGTPRDAAIAVLILLLPLVDTACVASAAVCGRRLDPRVAGLTGRLRALGLSRVASTLLLVSLQLALGALAVFAGRGVLSLEVTAVVAAIALGALLLAVLGANLPRKRERTAMVRLTITAAGLVVVLVALSVPSAVALLRARDVARDAAHSAEAGLAAARRGDRDASESAFLRAEDRFTEAKRRLDEPLVSGGLAVPVLSPNLRAARRLMDVGIDLARAGRHLTTTADPRKLRIRDGTLPIAQLTRLEPQLAATQHTLDRAAAQLAGIERAYLLTSVDDQVSRLERRLTKAVHDSRVAADAARILPAVFGGNGTRRYFLAVQNNAESRATGGFIGNWGLITATNGKLSLDRFEPVRVLNPAPEQTRTLHAPADYVTRYERFQPERRWQNVNASPDLPTVGPIIVDQLRQAGVGPVDGVVTVDPVGLADVLRLTGPVRVAGWPQPITAANVVDVTLRQAYVVFADSSARRDEFLGDVAEAVWRAFTNGDLGSPANVLRVLGQASHEKHLALWLADPKAQRLVHDARADAALPRGRDDLSLVTTQNAGQNKLDVYLRRKIRYHVQLVPDGDGRVAAVARLEVTLTNSSPSSGLPLEVLGPNLPDVGPGVNRSFVTVYSPLQFFSSSLDGVASGLEAQRELGYWADSAYVDLPPGATRTLAVDLAGKVRRGRNGEYRLELARQALAAPDDVEVVVDVAPRWRLTGARGLHRVDARRARYSGILDRDRALSVRIEPDPGDSLWDRLEAGR